MRRNSIGSMFGENMKRISMLMVLLMLCGCCVHPATENRPAAWAIPVQAAGVSNLFKVSSTLYRGEQPTASGMQTLKEMGIKTIINLRSFHSDRDVIGATDLRQEHIFMQSWYPQQEDAVKFIRLVTEPTNTPVFVHCHHGADRTGTLCAVYRIVVQGWTKQDAIREMTEGGYGFHEIWSNLPVWVEKLDVARLKKELEAH